MEKANYSSEDIKLKLEGLNLNINKEVLDDQRALEVSTEVPDKEKVSKDDKVDFENFKVLYADAIKDKCLEDFGVDDDEKLLEDTAKEMYLASKTYIPEEDKKADGELEKKTESKGNDIPETFEVSDLKRIAQKVLPKEDIDTHDGDLYLRKTPKSTELLKHMKDANCGLLSTFRSQDDKDLWYDIPFANWEDDFKKQADEYGWYDKKDESVVSDYTLDQIKRVLDSEETEYGYSLKITNSGADAETKTLDLDKEDLQAIYDALSKNKVTENKKIVEEENPFKVKYKAMLNGKEVKPGDKIKDFRGDEHIFKGITNPGTPFGGRNGKVCVDFGDGSSVEYYPSVFNIELVKVDENKSIKKECPKQD